MMTDESLGMILPRALLVLRVTLGIFLLQWGIEKFVVPGNTPAIWGYFYGLSVPLASAYLFGITEIAIALGLFLGLFRTLAYGVAMVLHAVSVLVTWRQLLNP
jgi:putative oxidoreductase